MKCLTCEGSGDVVYALILRRENCPMCGGSGMVETPPIVKFKGKHAFLSNFTLCSVEVDGIVYPSSEHAFQAMKTLYPEDREYIREAKTAGEAKKRGANKTRRKIVLRGDWEKIKEKMMLQVLRAKFFQNERLGSDLISTEDAELVEGNIWHDNFWGNCTCGGSMCCGDGENVLGKLLMQVREDLRQHRAEFVRASYDDVFWLYDPWWVSDT